MPIPPGIFGGLGTAVCNTAVSPSGSGLTAIYSGDANFAGSSAHAGLVTLPLEPGPPSAPIATFSNVHVAGNLVAGTVNCTASAGLLCDVAATLTVKETMSGRKVVAVSASHRPRPVTKTLTIGQATGTSVADGFSTLDVTLDATGRALLAAHHRLVARLTVTSHSSTGVVSTIFNGDVTFVQHKKGHH